MGLWCGLLSAATQVHKPLLEYLAILTIWSESPSMEVNVTGSDFSGCWPSPMPAECRYHRIMQFFINRALLRAPGCLPGAVTIWRLRFSTHECSGE